MYGKQEAKYLRQAEANPDSYLYRKICNSGPVATFRLLVEPSYDVDCVTVNRLEPEDSRWNKNCAEHQHDGSTAATRPTKRRRTVQ
ncbi:MAG: hypothetical protein ACRYE7_00290 [Janthinobacterium lividum]